MNIKKLVFIILIITIIMVSFTYCNDIKNKQREVDINKNENTKDNIEQTKNEKIPGAVFNAEPVEIYEEDNFFSPNDKITYYEDHTIIKSKIIAPNGYFEYSFRTPFAEEYGNNIEIWFDNLSNEKVYLQLIDYDHPSLPESFEIKPLKGYYRKYLNQPSKYYTIIIESNDKRYFEGNLKIQVSYSND